MTEQLTFQVLDCLSSSRTEVGSPRSFWLAPDCIIDLYTHSVRRRSEEYFGIGRVQGARMALLAARQQSDLFAGLEGRALQGPDNLSLKLCPLDHSNALSARRLFPFAGPVKVGLARSFGLGDRLGLANPAHLRSIAGSGFRPVLAQQSIRELERTNRTAEEVLDVATWAVLQEGWDSGFGADGDHLKTTADIDRVSACGYTMYTFDPGDHVANEADVLSSQQLSERMAHLDWRGLDTDRTSVFGRYADRQIPVSTDLTLRPSELDVARGLVKYGRVISHVRKMYSHLQEKRSPGDFEVELSVDETDSVTTPFEHYLVAAELMRLGVRLVSLAPRFVGNFEKGIDYRGDLDKFTEEFRKHLQIAEALGPYKLSLHSGSDKFSVYRVIGSLRCELIHIKTAGTSYLEALRAIAFVEPDLLREIYSFSRDQFPTARATYHVSASLDKVPPVSELSNADLLDLVAVDDDVRQVLHVSFGGVLTVRDESGEYRFRNRMLEVLDQHEETHFRCLREHFQRHLQPFQ